MKDLPIHIDVGRPDLTETEHERDPEATKVYVSGNGYQWAGFVIKNKSDLVNLHAAIGHRLVTLGDKGF